MSKSAVNLDTIGYPAVRMTFNEILQTVFERLTKAELKHAQAVLNLEFLDQDAAADAEMLADTASFSAKAGKKRAIDRIAQKLSSNRDPLIAMIAARLPTAVFSIFAIQGVHNDGSVLAHDLLDNARPIRIMDNSLAARAVHQDDILIAGRFVDLGPWHIGFGIVIPVRKSEVVAIGLALSATGAPPEARRDLHELIYTVQIHDLDLVMMAVEPVISALALAIDTNAINPVELTAQMDALLAGGPAGASKLARKARC